MSLLLFAGMKIDEPEKSEFELSPLVISISCKRLTRRMSIFYEYVKIDGVVEILIHDVVKYKLPETESFWLFTLQCQ